MQGTVHGPYARQIVNGRLKFWFALTTDKGEVRRYEVLFDPASPSGQSRHRPHRVPAKSRHQSAFAAFRVPDDLSAYPQARLSHRETLPEVARHMLAGQDAADVVRLVLTGQLPITETSS